MCRNVEGGGRAFDLTVLVHDCKVLSTKFSIWGQL